MKGFVLTTPSELYELKVLVEAQDWHDVATLMDSVDRALDPHQAAASGDRRWSVVANRLPAERASELLEFLGRGPAACVRESLPTDPRSDGTPAQLTEPSIDDAAKVQPSRHSR